MGKSRNDLNSTAKDYDPKRKKKNKIKSFSELLYNEALIEINSGLKVDNLYEKFELLIKQIIIPPPIRIETTVQHDFILEPMLKEYLETTQELRNLIRSTRKKMELWRHQSGYLEDLERLLGRSLIRTSTLNNKIGKTYTLIKERIELISPVNITPSQLDEAKIKLKFTIEQSLLSFCTIDLSDNTDPYRVFFIQQLTNFAKILIDYLDKSNIGLNHKTVANLDKHLKKHLGSKDILQRLFNDTRPQPIREIHIDALIAELFLIERITPGNNELKRQLAAIHHLISKISALPIRRLKDFKTLLSTEQAQHLEIINLYTAIEQQLIKLNTMIEAVLSLFPIEDVFFQDDVKNAQFLLNQLRASQSELLLIKQVYERNKDQFNLLQLTSKNLVKQISTQYHVFQKLDKLKKQVETHELEAQREIGLLDITYCSRRFALISKIRDTIHIIKTSVQSEILQTHAVAIAASEQLYQWLSDSALKHDLKSVKEQSERCINQLEQLIHEYKVELKVIWGKNIRSMFLREIPEPVIDKNSPISYISRLLNSYCTPWQMRTFSHSNPLKEPSNELNNAASNQLSSLIWHYSQLDEMKGTQLIQWISSIETDYKSTQATIARIMGLLPKADIIERRLMSKTYRASIDILKTLSTEFTRIFSFHYTEINKIKKPNPKIVQLKEDLVSLVKNQKLNQKSTELLNRLDIKLAPLFQMFIDFKYLNSQYINTEVDHCQNDLYIRSLCKIALDAMKNSLIAKSSKGLENKNPFTLWIRDNILKEILKYYDANQDEITPYISSLAPYIDCKDFCWAKLCRSEIIVHPASSGPRFFTSAQQIPATNPSDNLKHRVL